MTTPESSEGRLRQSKSLRLASGRELSKSTLFYLLHFGGWAIVGVISCAVDVSKKGLLASIMEGLLWTACGWLVTLCFRPVYRRARADQRSYAIDGLLCLVLSVFGAAVWYSATEALIRLGYFAAGHFPDLWPLLMAAAKSDAVYPWLIQPDFWLFFAIFLFTWSSLYFGVNAMLDLETERANVSQALKLADRARLRALQSNLNPHFLFNALNGIATLVRDRDATTASSMIDALSDFLRSTLQRLNSPEIQVAEEVQLIEQYLLIQRFRFGDRLKCSVDVAPETLSALIPTLILQPLVENAVLHGVLPREEGGSVHVSVVREGNALVVSVEDDGVGDKDALTHTEGLGLGNSRDRLQALYGDSAQLNAGRKLGDDGFAVVMRIPYRHSPQSPAREAPALLAS